MLPHRSLKANVCWSCQLQQDAARTAMLVQAILQHSKACGWQSICASKQPFLPALAMVNVSFAVQIRHECCIKHITPKRLLLRLLNNFQKMQQCSSLQQNPGHSGLVVSVSELCRRRQAGRLECARETGWFCECRAVCCASPPAVWRHPRGLAT